MSSVLQKNGTSAEKDAEILRLEVELNYAMMAEEVSRNLCDEAQGRVAELEGYLRKIEQTADLAYSDDVWRRATALASIRNAARRALRDG